MITARPRTAARALDTSSPRGKVATLDVVPEPASRARRTYVAGGSSTRPRSVKTAAVHLRACAAQPGLERWKQPPPGVEVVPNTTGRGDWLEKWRHPKTGEWVHNYTVAALERRAGLKFKQNVEFARQLPSIRARVRQDLVTGGQRGVVALVVALIDAAYFRVGNEESDDNGVYGATTLLKKHVRVRGSTVTFDFVGKKRVEQHRVVCDAVVASGLARLLRACTCKSARVFRHQGRVVDAAAVNDYLRPFGVTAKQFRTYHATRLAREHLLPHRNLTTEKERARAVSRMLEVVAGLLGHTPAVCRQSYIDPQVLERFVAGRLR